MQKKRKEKRWRLFADAPIQGPLILRIVIYWAVCQCSVVGTIYCTSMLSGQADAGAVSFWQMVIPAVVVSTIVLPLVLFDAIAFSNRFAGPLSRFRRSLHQLSETGDASEINFRPKDFYTEFAVAFNRLRIRIATASTIRADANSIGLPPRDFDQNMSLGLDRTPSDVLPNLDVAAPAELGQHVRT